MSEHDEQKALMDWTMSMEGRVPELLEVQRLPFSALEHNDAPHNTITRDAATPKAMTRKTRPLEATEQ